LARALRYIAPPGTIECGSSHPVWQQKINIRRAKMSTNSIVFHPVSEYRRMLLLVMFFLLFFPVKGYCAVNNLCANADGRFTLPEVSSRSANSAEDRAKLWAERVNKVSGYKTGKTEESVFLSDEWAPHKLWDGFIALVSLSSDAKAKKNKYVLGISLINKFTHYDHASNIVGRKMIEDMFSELTVIYCKYLKERNKQSFDMPIPKWKVGNESAIKPLYLLDFQDGVLSNVKAIE
jgi:hypothetical protein